MLSLELEENIRGRIEEETNEDRTQVGGHVRKEELRVEMRKENKEREN